MKLIIELVEKLKIYDQRVIDYRWSEYQNYEFGNNGLEEVASVGVFGEDEEEFESDEEESEDCLEHILTYAGFDESQIEDVRNKIREYRELPDMLSTDDEAYRIRKQLTPVFYDVYYKVFMRCNAGRGADNANSGNVPQFWLYGCADGW